MSKIEKIKAWVREHKELILTMCLAVVGGTVAAYANEKISDKLRGKAFSDGYNAAARIISGGMNPSKSMAMLDYEYAGFLEFADCDPEVADKMLARAGELGLGDDWEKIKFVRSINFIEFE